MNLHLNSTQAACSDVLRNRLTSDYAKLREEAKARTGGRPTKDKPSQLIDEVSNDPNDRRTDSVRAEEAGTNRSYISLGELLLLSLN